MFNALCFYKNFLHWIGITLIPVATLPEPNGHRGISFSSGYFIGVLLAMISSRKRRILQIAILTAIFVSLSFFLLTGKGGFNTSLFSRALAFIALGVTTLFIARNLTHETKIKKDKLEGIFAHSTQGIILLDRTGTIELANPFLKKMFGHEKDSLTGNTIKILIPGIALPEPLKNTTSSNAPLIYKDLLGQRKDGSTFTLEISFNTYTADGTSYWVGFANDTTEIKKVELEALMMEDRLHSKNKELRQVAYMVSHDLRAPIAKILGLASIFDNDAPENKFLVKKIAEATVHLDHVVKDMNNILATRHIEKENQEFIHFESKLKLITKVLEKEIKESKASITTDFHEANGVVTAKGHLYSILYNLLSNSIKYRLSETPLHIHLQSTEEEKFVCLSVKDNGMGIDLMKNEEKVFGLYKRFHGDTFPGKGVGLHLVKVHAESLGGKVEIESKVNEGTQFKIYIPKKNEPATA
jgi:PAS domain S-box-containing protein